MNLSADLLRGYTETLLLSQLSRGDSYGYQLTKRISGESGGAVELKEATLYTAFRRLESGGYIRSYWGDENTGARRKYYALTDLGALKQEEDRQTWRNTRDILNRLIGGPELML